MFIPAVINCSKRGLSFEISHVWKAYLTLEIHVVKQDKYPNKVGPANYCVFSKTCLSCLPWSCKQKVTAFLAHLKSSPLKILGRCKPNLVRIITMMSSFKIVSGDAVHQPTWPLLLKIEHMVKLQVLDNNSKTVNNIKNLTWGKND